MPYLRQKNFQGGLSDSENTGVEGSFYEGVGVNIHGKPGMATVNQKLTKESGTTVTDFVKSSVQGTNGITYFFGDTGRIYSRSADGTYTLAYTRSSNDAILSACEYDGYLYYTTAAHLHRKPLPGLGDWSDHQGDWGIFTNGDTKYHPMIVNGLYLYVGDGRAMATVDDLGNFTANGIYGGSTFTSLPHGFRARCLYNYDTDILIGSVVDETINKARVFRWDGTSSTYDSTDEIGEPGIQAFVPIDNSVFAICGNRGNMYFYDGKSLREPPAKRLRGNYSSTDFIEVHPDAVDGFDGLAMIGVSRSAGEPILHGVYSIGRYDKNYPLALNLEYLISTNSRTSVEIGVIKAVGQNMFVSWKDWNDPGSLTYGIDKIDWTTKYASAYLITRDLSGDRLVPKTFNRYICSFKDCGGDASLKLSYIKNYGTATSLASYSRTATDENYIIADQHIDTGNLQIKVEWETTGNSAMAVEEIAIEWNPKKPK